jgi:S1-C subfamily serine protease
VRQTIQLQGPDIYDDGEVTREVYTVRAVVRSGNSGGPMVDVDGQVVGVVFGAALDDSETGFVLTNAQVSAVVNPAARIDDPVGTGPCAS